jgi:predicted signal transduction protein with EAL and GGDEF domain
MPPHDHRDVPLRLAGAPSAFCNVVLGGDEFALLVGDLHDQAELDTVADRVHRLLAEPVRLPAQGEIMTAASIGTAVIDAADAPETVLARADAAMYADKMTRRTARVPPPTGPDTTSPRTPRT